MNSRPRLIGILSAFPREGHRKSAIAYYVQTILRPLYGNSAEQFLVFGDKEPDEPEFCTQEVSNVRVFRSWSFGIKAPAQIFRTLLKRPVDILHVEYDVYLYGGIVAAILLPIVLRIMRLLRPRLQITTTLHGVVSPRVVTREFLRENGFVLPYSRIGKFGFAVVYRLFNWSSNRIIVLEQKLRDILIREYRFPAHKVFVVPLPLMNENQRPDTESARKRSGIKEKEVILFVGFASYYKGLGVLLDSFERASQSRPQLRLDVVAGRHPRLVGNAKYEKFYSALREKAGRIGAVWHDFLPEDQLSDILAVSTLVVFPYTSAYGGSAALNTALAARKPVLVSSVVYFEEALDEQVFEPTVEGCTTAMLRFLEDPAPISRAVAAQARARKVDAIAALNHRVRCGGDLSDHSNALRRLAYIIPDTTETVHDSAKQVAR